MIIFVKQNRKARRKLDVSQEKAGLKENLAPETPPPAPRKVKHPDLQPADLPTQKEGLRDKNLSDMLLAKKSSSSKMNGAAQTDMGKGTAMSHTEAPVRVSLWRKMFNLEPSVAEG